MTSGYRWVVLLMCWAAFTMTSVDRSTWGPAAASVSDSLHVPLAALGVFATGYYLGYLVSNAGGGVLVDWLGARALLTASGVGAGLAMVLFGSATSVATGLALQGAVGLLAGVDFAAGVKMISVWFPAEQLGLASGVFLTATSLGTVIANAVVPSLILAADWHASYHLFGAVTVVIGLLCGVLVREPATSGTDAAPRPRELPDPRAVLANRDLLLLGLAGFGGLWGTYGFVTWSNTLMTKGSGIDPVSAGVVLVIFAGVAIGVKPLIGWVCDRLGLGLRMPIVVVLVYFAVVLVVFGRLHSYTQFLWVAPFLGIGAYAYSPLTAALTPLLSGRRSAGSAAGAVNAFWQLGSVLVPSVIGPVFASTGSFSLAFATLAAGPLLGALVGLFVHEPRPAAETRTPAPA
ncbi:MFS transporter [Pseudonocardia eucalypti]|uniref:MFS transporter n=1 Tax=Pseudonocardia eucalypti TaxID=648755 RepID=A0ABP9QLN8_9PSEU|nr:sugar phosphate permease [Pseudonocardia eucalypti]